MDFPSDLKYTESDEWVRLEGKGRTIGAIESVKAAADLYSPVSGTLKEINESLASAPELVNSDPYGAGWMARVELSDSGELDGLMDSAAYRKHCEERSH